MQCNGIKRGTRKVEQKIRSHFHALRPCKVIRTTLGRKRRMQENVTAFRQHLYALISIWRYVKR